MTTIGGDSEGEVLLGSMGGVTEETDTTGKTIEG
jgi:hypothetical protein